MSDLMPSPPQPNSLLTPHEIETLKAEKARRRTENRLAYYKPYPKQFEFHAAGDGHRERMFCAANQVGKTWGGGNEGAAHATGIYPEAVGSMDRPNFGWACGVTSEVVRDTV